MRGKNPFPSCRTSRLAILNIFSKPEGSCQVCSSRDPNNGRIYKGYSSYTPGVMLKIGENKALVKADIEDRKIIIVIEGVEHTRLDALSAIGYQLDEIHASIKGLDAQKRVPVPNAPKAEALKYEYQLKLDRAA